MRGETWWLIGASEGLGRALAQAMAARGARVIVSARQADRLSDLVATLPDGRAVAMDVTDGASVAEAAAQAGEVDGIVYLSGAYWPLRAQDWDTDKILAMIDVNFTGAARVLGATLPTMVARNRGRVVITGSLAGFRGLPGSIGYGSSKAGLMHLAECLQADLRGTGVRVQLINPGFIKTRLTDKNDFSMPFILEPEAAAQHMIRAIDSGRSHTSFPTLFSWLFRIGRFLPEGLWHRIFAKG